MNNEKTSLGIPVGLMGAALYLDIEEDYLLEVKEQKLMLEQEKDQEN